MAGGITLSVSVEDPLGTLALGYAQNKSDVLRMTIV